MTDFLKSMRDVFIEEIYDKMCEDKNIFFLSADFGSSSLDKLRKQFRSRFINIGIAEQDLINVSTGLALEGFTVYAYGLAPFLTMRAYEQCRNNLSLLSAIKEINVNLIGVGAGLSYDLSGPSHHCLEDLTLMGLLPEFHLISPSDWVVTKNYVGYSLDIKKPKYFRLDAKPLPAIYKNFERHYLENGFCELMEGRDICLVATGYMTHQVLKAAMELKKEGIRCGILDVFLLKPLKENAIFDILTKYKYVVSVEEAFLGKGGLDAAVLNILSKKQAKILFKSLGFHDKYVFERGEREYLHKLNNIDVSGIVKFVKNIYLD